MVPDVERTALMVDLLREQHPSDGMSLSHIVIEEVAPGTGWMGGARWADVLVLSVWQSKGRTLKGYEIKASRADLKKECADLGKHQALARYCDEWWLVAWDESVLVDTVPADWGIMLTVEGEYGRELVMHRKAAKRTPEPWPRAFVCSLVRNAFEQSPGMAYTERLVRQARVRAETDGKVWAKSERRALLERFAKVIYGKTNRWDWPKEARDDEKLEEIIAQRLSQGVLGVVA